MAGNLVIGATVDVEQLKGGFDGSVETVKAGTQQMAVSFQELSTTATRAARQTSDDRSNHDLTRLAKSGLDFLVQRPALPMLL